MAVLALGTVISGWVWDSGVGGRKRIGARGGEGNGSPGDGCGRSSSIRVVSTVCSPSVATSFSVSMVVQCCSICCQISCWPVRSALAMNPKSRRARLSWSSSNGLSFPSFLSRNRSSLSSALSNKVDSARAACFFFLSAALGFGLAFLAALSSLSCTKFTGCSLARECARRPSGDARVTAAPTLPNKPERVCSR